MKNIIEYINEWGGEKIRKPSMKNQLEMLRNALNENIDSELLFEYDYIITDMIYNGKELEITISSDNSVDREYNIDTVEGGTHLVGFKTALTRAFNDYAKRFGHIKDNDKNFTGDDIREGLTAVISVKIEDPQFEGQTKTKLGNSEVRGIVDSIVGESISTFLASACSISFPITFVSIKSSESIIFILEYFI